MTPTEELLELPFLKAIQDTLKAYQYSKRCNVLRVMAEAAKWGKRGATVNSISPGIVITPLANDELNGPRKEGYRKMLSLSPAGRAGTPDELGDLAEFLMSIKAVSSPVATSSSTAHDGIVLVRRLAVSERNPLGF